MKYVIFHICAFITFLSFLISILWTKGIIKDALIASISRIKIRLRNFIDLMMMITRFILPLPFIEQLRFEINIATLSLGFIIFIIGIYFIAAGVYKIHRKLMYNLDINLVTDGVYGIVRHPIYFGDIMWPIGLSIIFGAICSLLLSPIWIIFYLYTISEEEKVLIHIYGDRYLNYRRRVKKIIPFIY